MCGIFGFVSIKAIGDTAKLAAVSKIMQHRGPDDEGFMVSITNRSDYKEFKGDSSPEDLDLPYISDAKDSFNLAFLHRRLSIIDLSIAGHQPMSYTNGNYWITLNGEIYNYLEIKTELEKLGYLFKSNTDTEVVLASFAHWGRECVKHFNGMWAFAIWDVKKQHLFLSRDRLGVKPLYYTYNDGTFIFSSEIKGILAYSNIKFEFNERKIREYLIKGQVIIGESEETIFNGISQLQPGCNLIFKENNYNIDKYWHLEINMSKASREEHLRRFMELFHDSLKLRMRSDVEVGSCLSGGVDSTSIVSYASKEFKVKFNTFSAIWPNTRHDEYKYMKLVNEMYNTNSNYIETDLSDIIGLIDKITWHQEIPIAGSSLVAQWEVMKKARKKGVPVLLDGQGADEILSGYPIYLVPYVNEMFTRGKIRALIHFIKNKDYYGFGLVRIVKQQLKRYLLKPEIKPLLPISKQEQNKYYNTLRYNSSLSSSFLPDYLKEQIEKSNLSTLLHFEDRNSMAHSIEARVPFLDYRLVEYCINIPSEQKISKGFTKTILRDAMRDYIPKEIFMRRDKIGFSTPIEEQINNKESELYKYMIDYLHNSELWNSKWLDKEKYRDKHLFALYSLQRFMDIYRK